MRKAPRYLTLVLILLAFVVAGRQLAIQQTAATDVLMTGLYLFGGVLLLFVLLIGVGKGLGFLVNRGKTDDDETM